MTRDLFLYHYTTENTRFSVDLEPSHLDLLFTNDEMMISDVDMITPLEKVTVLY